MRSRSGIKKLHTIISEDARQAATPFPCGQCLPCRINKSRIWTVRLLLEQSTSEFSYFITVTIDDDNLNMRREVVPKDLQKFIKRLRKRLSPGRFRYFAVGEYGDETHRPHYHLAVFSNIPIFLQDIEDTWHQGKIVEIQELNKDLAKYIVGYVVKKMTDPKDDRLLGRHPEFMRCSKQDGGLGIEGIKRIAEKLIASKYYDFDKNPILREFRVGKKDFPIGKYLTDKLIGMTHRNWDKKEDEYWYYQQDIFDSGMFDADDYYEFIRSAEETKRTALEKRNKIFKQRRKI